MRNERPSLANSIRGDLAEERARRAQTQSPVRAAAWYARTALGIAAQVMLLRVAHGRRDIGRGLRFDRLRGDGKQALRTLRRSPWYAATATVVVALSFALATTVFALVDGVLFKPLPYHAPDQLFVVSPGFTALASPAATFVSPASVPDVRAWAASVPEARFATFNLGGATTIADQETLRSAEVDAAFFDVLRAPPLRGGHSPAPRRH